MKINVHVIKKLIIHQTARIVLYNYIVVKLIRNFTH